MELLCCGRTHNTTQTSNYGDLVPTSRKPTTQQLKTCVVGFLDVGTCGPPYIIIVITTTIFMVLLS